MSVDDFSGRVNDAISCGQAATWICTSEPAEVLLTLRQLCNQYDWNASVYDAAGGITQLRGEVAAPKPPTLDSGTSYLSALRGLASLVNARQQRRHDNTSTPEDDRREVLFVKNAHLEYTHDRDTRAVFALTQTILSSGKDVGVHLMLQSYPGIEPARELRDEVWVLEHQLPSADERQMVIRDMLLNAATDMPEEEQQQLAEITGGLTRNQLADACALLLYRDGTISDVELLRLKAEIINRGGLLRVTYGPETFSDLGGLDGIKRFTSMSLARTADVKARCIMLVGVPGGGKSVISRAIGKELGRPTLVLDLGRLMGGVVGKTEEQTREALAIADAMAPAVLYID